MKFEATIWFKGGGQTKMTGYSLTHLMNQDRSTLD